VVPALADELLNAGGFRLVVPCERTEVVVLVDRGRALLAARRERDELGRRYGGDAEYEQYSSADHGLFLEGIPRWTRPIPVPGLGYRPRGPDGKDLLPS
jgi:hypothetical protein